MALAGSLAIIRRLIAEIFEVKSNSFEVHKSTIFEYKIINKELTMEARNKLIILWITGQSRSRRFDRMLWTQLNLKKKKKIASAQLQF